MVSGNKTMIRANGVAMCIETFGDPHNPALLLISGAACSMDWWDDDFCEHLAAGSRFVIRYDLRDTGQSVSYEPGAPPYMIRDLAADAIEILDALNVINAHVVGLSMGGVIGQVLAVEHPERVASLTLMSSTPGDEGGSGLPPPEEKLSAVFADPAPEPDWSDRSAVIDYMVDGERPFAGSIPFDESAVRELAERVFDRTVNIASSMTNHPMLAGGDTVRPRLKDITAPTLVLHGTDDPLFPFGHAEALQHEIPGARLMSLDGVGHQYPPRDVWDVVIPEILKHTSDA